MKKLISSILVFAVIAASILTIPLTSANATETPGGEYEISYNASDRVIVSLGDSYSAGEGLGDYYDGDFDIPVRVKSEAWLSHRSKKSWPGQLKLTDDNGNIITMKDYDGEISFYPGFTEKERHWYFAAMSGAVTYDITASAYKHYDKKDSKTGIKYKNKEYKSGENIPDEVRNISPQVDIFNQLGNKKTDYITMTLGGNDIQFVGVVTQAALNVPFLEYAVKDNPTMMRYQPLSKYTLAYKLNDMVENVLPDTLVRLEEKYKTIAEKAGSQAHIIIAGYPKILSTDSNNPIFTKTDSEMIAEKVTYFNNRICETVKKCEQNGMNISFVYVDGDNQFGNHGAYSPNGEYVCGLTMTTKTNVSQEIKDTFLSGASFHPNEYGAEVYRKCVQDEIDRIESQKTRVWGKVVDKNNNPKPGVRVILTDDKNEVNITNTSDSKGNYGIELDYKEGRHYTITFESDDYAPLVVKEVENRKRITVNAKLQKNRTLVEDAMRGTYKFYGNTCPEFAIPKINLNSTDTKNANREILNKFQDCFKDNNEKGICSLDYSYVTDGNTLSVLIDAQYMDNGYRTYSAYSFDISTGKLLTGTELLSQYNYSESNAVVSAQNDIIKRYSGQVGVTDDAVIQRQRQKALDQNKNISNMQFYIDNNKKVNIIYYAAWVAGSEGYYYSIPITKDEPIAIPKTLEEEKKKHGLSTLVGMWDTPNARTNSLHDCIDFYNNSYSITGAAPYNGTYNGYRSLNTGTDCFFNYSYNNITGDLTVTAYK